MDEGSRCQGRRRPAPLRRCRQSSAEARCPVTGSLQSPANDMNGEFISENLRTPVVAEYDVIVVGGGASGCAAAIAAARAGARVLVLERGGCLGGAATANLVAQWVAFFHGDVRVVAGI